MSDRDGRSELPVAPGQAYVEVEYDYDYKSKDRTISIRQGECYQLVRKANEDWWQVRKDESSKPFYAPAQYVREVRRALMPPPKPLPHTGVAPRRSSDKRPTHLELRRSDESLNKQSPSHSPTPSTSSGHLTPPIPSREAGSSPGSPSPQRRCGGDGSGDPQPNHPRHGSLPRSRAESPLGRRKPLDLDMGGEREKDGERDRKERRRSNNKESGRSRNRDSQGEGGGLEKSRNDSESGDELSSSSTEQLQTVSAGQGRADSPVYTNLQELKISQTSQPPAPSSSPLQTLGDWEVYKDSSGRHYYYNPFTQERTWKPPRSRDTISRREDTHSNADTEPLSSEENCLSTYSSQSDSQYGSPPRGWSEELDEHGHTLYVCDYTNEKWIKHTDDKGRPYYYSADGSRSEWELPKVNIRSQTGAGDAPKTRSLDRRPPDPIVLTKWRHSTYNLDSNDKLRQRSVKNRRIISLRRKVSTRLHPYRLQDYPKPSSPDSDSSCPSSPKHPSSPSEKSGNLNVTKITEQGKKVRKNWTSSWAVLHGSSLQFAKSQGGWFGSHQTKPDFSVDLRGGSVDWASKDKSSKKNVLELKTRQGTEVLIQSDNDGTMNDWLRILKETIDTHVWESDEAIEEDMPESPGAEKQDKEKEHRDSKKSRAMKNSTSMDSSDQKKTRTKLKKFLTRRPTLQAVRDKGYIEDQVFGCDLSSLCQSENSTVPHFVIMCIDHVESRGLSLDGLYRVSGNLAIIQKLRFAVNHDECVNLEDRKWEDIHVITGALKMFFRELSEPLFTYTLFNDFISAIKVSDYRQRVQAVKELVKKLPPPNHDTMQVLFKHLRKVIDHGEENRMTTQSVAIVFGPTLLRPEVETWNMAVHMVYQNQIVELILLEYETIFGR
ncbi:rho GTPase-activating protein 12-like [Chanos chanos]|uniref:Rho GTPase-activating protein 12-like n=1 Tax=Chanos chanos TaxID=29144 RepID=A0A6J2V9Y1_CHACN|nr:rho GTPase-activating protein 12-like [Chanos chanos]